MMFLTKPVDGTDIQLKQRFKAGKSWHKHNLWVQTTFNRSIAGTQEAMLLPKLNNTF